MVPGPWPGVLRLVGRGATADEPYGPIGGAERSHSSTPGKELDRLLSTIWTAPLEFAAEDFPGRVGPTWLWPEAEGDKIRCDTVRDTKRRQLKLAC